MHKSGYKNSFSMEYLKRIFEKNHELLCLLTTVYTSIKLFICVCTSI